MRVGLGQIGNVSRALLERVVEERANGLYRDLRDFLQRVSPSRAEMRVLIRSGALGLMISRHPLSIYRSSADRRALQGCFPPLIYSVDIPRWHRREVSLAGLLVTGKEVTTIRKEQMVFVSFEDEMSIYETVFFPPAYRRFSGLVETGGLFLLAGRVDEEDGVFSIRVSRIVRLQGTEA